MVYWTIVEIVYILDVIIFGYLAYFFLKALKGTVGESKIVIKSMVILTTVLFLQELYFGIKLTADPNALALFPEIHSIFAATWVYAKIILTLAGITIIYTLMKLKK